MAEPSVPDRSRGGEDVTVRPYRPEDLEDVYDVCIRTGATGQDATGTYADDRILPDIWAGPYLLLEPELAIVVDDGSRVVGYVLGTADTKTFLVEYLRRWLPRVRDRHPTPVDDPGTPYEYLVALLHDPGPLEPELAAYPAHLHIDLLPSHQGRGLGRELTTRFLGALHRRGVGAVHLGTSTANLRSQRFYEAMGFHRVEVAGADDVVFFGRSTEPDDHGTGRRPTAAG